MYLPLSFKVFQILSLNRIFGQVTVIYGLLFGGVLCILANHVTLPDLFHEHFHLVNFVEECAHLLVSFVFLGCQARHVSSDTLVCLNSSFELVVLVVHCKHWSNSSFLGCSIESIHLLTRGQQSTVIGVIYRSRSRVTNFIICSGYISVPLYAFEDLLFL